jgi:hypothetical protein
MRDKCAIRNPTPWLVFLALLALQFLLFYRHAKNEIVWAYPRNFDQAVYLERAYEISGSMPAQGAGNALAQGTGFQGGQPSGNGALMHLEAAVMFAALGADRMTALSLGFIHFALFQLVLLYTLRAIGGLWPVAWMGLGLLLGARTTFQTTGGIMDFRMDFTVFCLFGVFICLVLLSDVFRSLKWSMAAALVIGYTICFRFLTLAYFLPIFLLSFGLICIAWGRGSDADQRRRQMLPRLRNLLLAGCVVALLCGPVLLHHWAAISNYYLRLHASGPQRYIRARMFKNTTWQAALLYYPRSLALHHGGLVFLGLALAVVVARFVIRFRSEGSERKPAIDSKATFAFVLICFFVPLAALTWDVDKNAAVGDVLVGPLLWIILLVCGIDRANSVQAAALKTYGKIAAAGALAVGLTVQVFSYTRHSELTLRRPQVMAVLGLHDRIWATCQRNGWNRPLIANDSYADDLFSSAINDVTWERHGILLEAREVLATDYTAKTPAQIVHALEQCQIALMTRRQISRSGTSPFEASIAAARPQMEEYLRAHFVPATQLSAMDRDIVVWMRKEPSDARCCLQPDDQTHSNGQCGGEGSSTVIASPAATLPP